MKIEQVCSETFALALALYQISWKESHRDICTPVFLEQRDYAGYLRKKMDGLYCIWAEEPVGIFFLKDENLSDMYVHPQKTGRGYGTACIRFAQARSKMLHLTVLSTNKTAIQLYKKLGFRFTGRDRQLRGELYEREMIYTEKENG